MSFVGISIGALTVKAVTLRGDTTTAVMAAHQGRPLEVLGKLIAAPQFADVEYFGVTGALGHITEVAVIQRALRETGCAFDAIASLGGESFLVYILADGRIANVLSHNKCAAGSGEFFVQQIGRMGLSLDDAIRRSFAGKVVPLASRCSVHCKSDITHKLNRHEPTHEEILHTLLDSMENKVVALLDKAQPEPRRVLLIAQPEAGHAGAHLRKRRLRGRAGVSAAGGRAHPAGSRMRRAPWRERRPSTRRKRRAITDSTR
jgi:activator of 2-hydroxyglutaryl-CoA dehydratase